MELQRTIYKPKVRKMFDLETTGIYYLKLRGSIYFLSSYKYNSINLLRKATNYETKEPKDFYNIVHDNYLLECEKTRKTNEKKFKYYKEIAVKKRLAKIEKLKLEIKELEEKNATLSKTN